MISMIEDDKYVRILGSEKSVMNGLFISYGAIEFPLNDQDGCCVIGLKNVSNGDLLVPSVCKFRTFLPVIHNGILHQEGLLPFLLENYLHYRCSRLFYFDDKDISRKMRIEIEDNNELYPQPHFKKLKNSDLTSLFSLLSREKLKYASDGLIQKALMQYSSNAEKSAEMLVIKTLGTLSYGFDRYFK